MKNTVISISLPIALSRRIKEVQKQRSMTQSELFRTMIRKELELIDHGYVADHGGSFDFLRDEPDHYSAKDIK